MEKKLRDCPKCNKRTKHTYWKRENETTVAWSFCLICGNAVSVEIEIFEYCPVPRLSTSSQG